MFDICYHNALSAYTDYFKRYDINHCENREQVILNMFSKYYIVNIIIIYEIIAYTHICLDYFN